MKTSFHALVSLAALTGGLALVQAGCSATATRQSTGEYIDDNAISAKIKAALVSDPVVKALQVNVETFKGDVQLSGFVDTEAQKAQAERVARTVTGVGKITNNLEVKKS